MRLRSGGLLAALVALTGCRGDRAEPERPDSTLAATAPPPVELRLAAPDTLGWNQTDSVRITLINRTAAPLRGGLWLSLAAPALLDSAGVDSLTRDGAATRAWLPLADVAPGDTLTLTHGFRLPPAPAANASAPRDYLVRVSLAAPALAREDTVHVRPGSEAVAGGCADGGSTLVQRYGLGPVRIRMRAAALRAACPQARDSAWEAEGAPQRGLVVRVGGAPILAEIAGDSVWRIMASDPRVRTAAGLGVGSTLAELRARYGAACAGIGEGPVYVWFQNAPGISFALDSVSTRGWAAAGQRPQELPDSARVDGLAVHGLDPRCPAATRE